MANIIVSIMAAVRQMIMPWVTIGSRVMDRIRVRFGITTVWVWVRYRVRVDISVRPKHRIA